MLTTKSRSLVLVLALASFGCADGQSLLELTITSPNLSGVQFLRIQVTNAKSQMSQPIDISLNPQKALPPDVVVLLGFDKSTKGTVTITVDAMDSSSISISSKTITTQIKPSKKQTLTLELPANGPPLDLAGADLTALDLAAALDGSVVDLATEAPADLAAIDLIGADFFAPHVGKLSFNAVLPGPAAFVGAQLTSIEVSLLDDSSTPRGTATDVVTLSLSSAGTTGIFGTLSVAAVNGVATFSNVRVDDIGTGLKLIATSPGSDPAMGSAFNIVDPTWQSLSSGPFGGNIRSLTFDAHDKKTLYAASVAGLFRANDGTSLNCCSWQLVSTYNVFSLATSPVDNRLYAVNDFGQVQTSTDRGDNWDNLDNAPTGANTVALDRKNSASVWVGTSSGTVQRSTDSGATFSDWSTSLPTGSYVESLVILSGGGTTVAVAGLHDKGIYTRTNSASGWSLAASPAPSGAGGYGGLTPDRADDAGVWLIWDADLRHYHYPDAAWTLLTGPDSVLSSIGQTSDAQSFSTASSNHIYSTTNGGSMWTARTDPPFAVPVLESDTATHLVGGTADGVYDTNGTSLWQKKNFSLTAFTANVIEVDPTNAATVYVGEDDGVGGMYRSTTGGNTWFPIGPTGVQNGVRYIVLDPQNSKTIYADIRAYGLYKSSDSGANWTSLRTDNVCGVAVDPTNSMVVYAGGDAGFLKSVDGGQNWNAIGAGLPAGYPCEIKINPKTPSTLYTIISGLTYKSIDSGANWLKKSGGQTNVSKLAIDPATPDTLYAMSSSQVFKTTDGGESNWADSSTGITGGKYLLQIQIDAIHPNKLYLLEGTSILRSVDSGGTWTVFTSPAKVTRSLSVAPSNPGVLYLGEFGHGILQTVVTP